MATKKRKHTKRRARVGAPKRKHSRRRRRGAFGSPQTDTLMDFAGLAIGFFGAGMTSNVLTLDPKTMSYLKLGAGLGGAMFMGSNKIVKNIALGVALSGVHDVGMNAGYMLNAPLQKDPELFVNLSGAEEPPKVLYLSERTGDDYQHMNGSRDLNIIGARDLNTIGDIPYIGAHDELGFPVEMGSPMNYVNN